jgi:hypothetical protein
MSRNLVQLRRPMAVAAVSTLLLACGADAALAAKQPATTSQRIYACVSNDMRGLDLTTRGGRCARGEQKISWAVEGPRGKTGAAGPRGAAGATGANGATGPAGPAGAKGESGAKGETGARGETGAKGDTGDRGPIGPQGLIGPVGPIGQQGPVGDTGPRGTDGDTGPQGAAGTTLEISSGHASFTTRPGGLPDNVTALPLSGVRTTALTYTDGTPAPFAATQVVAAPVTFTTLRLSGQLAQAMSLVGSTVTPHVALVVGGVQTSLACNANPLTGILSIGTPITATCSGSVPLAAGDLAYVAVSADATGITLVNALEADVTASLG